MKHSLTAGLMVVMAACSSHPVKCHGPLRPINEPTAGVPTGKVPAGVSTEKAPARTPTAGAPADTPTAGAPAETLTAGTPARSRAAAGSQSAVPIESPSTAHPEQQP